MKNTLSRYLRALMFTIILVLGVSLRADTAYVTSYTGSTLTACPPFCTLGGSISLFGSTDISSAPGVPSRTRAVFGFGGVPSWSIRPTLNVPGGVYRIDAAHNSSSTLSVVSADVLVTVTSSDGSVSPSCVNTPVFQRAYGGPVWNTIGYITNNPGVSEPVLVFTVSGGTVGPSTGNRIYIDAFRFTAISAPPTLPTILNQPASRTNIVGTTATFTVTATGTEPLIYRWRKDDVELFDGGRVSGAATATLTVTDVSPDDSGNYTVDVSNIAGSVTSVPAFLQVSVPPVARITVSPLAQFPGITNLVVIAPDGTSANVILDGSESSDDGPAPLQYQWFDGSNFLADTVTVTNAFDTGLHTFTLLVNDGELQDIATAEVEIITPSESVGILIHMVQESNLSIGEQRPLLAVLQAVFESFERGNLNSALQQLGAFQNQVEGQVASENPALAEQLISTAQIIVDAIAQ